MCPHSDIVAGERGTLVPRSAADASAAGPRRNQWADAHRSPCRRRGRSSGLSLLYTGLIMIVLVGFVSFAVDVGRVQLAKTELRATADAAARAGVSGVFAGPTEAINRAVAYGAANTCLGTPVEIDASDVELGHWSRKTFTFTALSPSDAANPSYNANAVRVHTVRSTARGNAVALLFAPVVGQSRSDVGGLAAAAVRGGNIRAGLVGINSASLSGSVYIDSYDSSKGGYSLAAAQSNGDISSNGTISVSGGGQLQVHGSLHPGPAQTGVSTTGNPVIAGEVEPLTAALAFPAVDTTYYVMNNDNAAIPAVYLVNGVLTLAGTDSYTLPAGTYYFAGISMSDTPALTIGGAVTIYVAGDINIAGTLSVASNRPGDLRINVAGNHSISFANKSDLYADIYAPQSALNLSGNSQFYGAFVGSTLSSNGSPGIHYDESLARIAVTPMKIFLVQ